MENLNMYRYKLKLVLSTMIFEVNEIVSTNLDVEEYHEKERLMGKSSSAGRDSTYRAGRKMGYSSDYKGDLSKGIITNATALGKYILENENKLEYGCKFSIKNGDGNFIEYEVLSKIPIT